MEQERHAREERAAEAGERREHTKLVQAYLFAVDEYILDAELAGEVTFGAAWPDVRTTMLRIVEGRAAAWTAAEERTVAAASNVLGEYSSRGHLEALQLGMPRRDPSTTRGPVRSHSQAGLSAPSTTGNANTLPRPDGLLRALRWALG
jgi:hypothetical protein